MNTKNHGAPRKKRTKARARNASVREDASNALPPTDHAMTVTDKEPETGYDLRGFVFGMLKPPNVELSLKAQAVFEAISHAGEFTPNDGRKVRITSGIIDHYYRVLMKKRLLRNVTSRTR
jgi:hypothetical protein